MNGVEEAKAAAGAFIDSIAQELVAASHDIHAHPELGWQEHHASALLADLGRRHGLDVELGAYGIETAFVARSGTSGANVAVCCEYDALPGIGHGCGHNIIGAAGLGAGLALAELARVIDGRVTILGTPAEEVDRGGKRALLDAGAFADADVAMMVHPEAGDVERVPYLATDRLSVQFHGRSAHASSSPWQAVNALDAIVLAYNGLSTLRQQLEPVEKVHGIITEGGVADNVIPDYTAGLFRARAPSSERLAVLKERVLACFEGAATQTGCRLEAAWTGGHEDVRANRALAAAYRRNGEAIGRRFAEPHVVAMHVAGSTDMGDVSKVVPSIHPVIAMCPLDVPGHSEAFAEWAVSARGDRAVVDGAKALAMTGIDVWLRPDLLAAAREEFAWAKARAKMKAKANSGEGPFAQSGAQSPAPR